MFGVIGVNSEASQGEWVDAKHLSENYLNREISSDENSVLQGSGWWFIPEGWIGMLGFVVEVQSCTVFPLGSGLQALHGRSGLQAPRGAIEA
jgi:hypothetical protein